MSSLSVDRLLSMSSMTALAKVRDYSARSKVSFLEAATSLPRISAELQTLDYEAAALLDAFVESVPFGSYEEFYRLTLKRVIERELPFWVRLASAGRSRLCEALPENILQSFRSAGLLVDKPGLPVIQWWDEIAGIARHEHDKVKLEHGRLAESLTMELEASRLQHLGLAISPQWVAIEDNSAGYDILSFDPGEHGPTARMIEVKSCSSSTVGFHLSRNEWETAARSQCYIIHLWELPSRTLIELDASEISRSVPIDQGCGEWQSAFIRVQQTR
jgi:hypothetical protein